MLKDFLYRKTIRCEVKAFCKSIYDMKFIFVQAWVCNAIGGCAIKEHQLNECISRARKRNSELYQMVAAAAAKRPDQQIDR